MAHECVSAQQYVRKRPTKIIHPFFPTAASSPDGLWCARIFAFIYIDPIRCDKQTVCVYMRCTRMDFICDLKIPNARR